MSYYCPHLQRFTEIIPSFTISETPAIPYFSVIIRFLFQSNRVFFSCFSDTNTQITHTQMGCSSCLCYFFLSLYNDWILCTADIFLTSEKEKNQDGYFYRVQSLIRDLYTSPDTRGIRNQYIQCLQLSNYGNVKLYYAVFTSNCVVHTFTACVCLCARYTHSTATQIDIWAAEETSCGRNVFINVKNISKCK